MHHAAVVRPARDHQLSIVRPVRDGVAHDARRCASGAHVMREEGRRRKRRWRGRLDCYLAGNLCLAPTSFSRKSELHGITDSACKNQLVVVSVQYGPFNPYISIRSTTIGKSRVAIYRIAMHTSWRSNSDITSVTSIGYPRMSASGESSTTMHRLLHASGSHPIPPPDDPK
ncbi:protein TPRXL [Dorcoceras hygrometricum]|uniref:Protein TPRXL n=1 Tax=Dorcoceras hygrometricum TaxID=472368 RepID=A0A2Z7AFX3_9LAMI|nr:protein TPRXL [Dorcoceras hygrometricum]